MTLRRAAEMSISDHSVRNSFSCFSFAESSALRLYELMSAEWEGQSVRALSGRALSGKALSGRALSGRALSGRALRSVSNSHPLAQHA